MGVRRVVRIGFKAVAGLVVVIMAAVLVILGTQPGHSFLQGRLISLLNDAVDGSVRLGRLSGPLWKSVQVDSIEMLDKEGHRVIAAQQVSVSYRLPDLLRGKLIFRNVRLVRPVIELDQDRDGRWNIEKLFRITSGDTATHPDRPLVELRDARIDEGTLILHARGAEDTIVTRSVRRLNTDLARLRLSHPDSSAIVADLRSLAANVDNPALELRNADGVVSLDGDSLRFDVDHVTLPGTHATLAGQMRWGGPHLQLVAALNADPIAFADVRGIVPELPEEGGGTIAVRASMDSSGTIAADVREANLRSGRSVVRGRGAFTVRANRTGTARGVDLQLEPFDFALLQEYVKDLPVRGTVRGHVHGEGTLTDLVMQLDLDWTDEGSEGRPHNVVQGEGRMIFGGEHGVDFREFALRRADMDLASIRSFAPSLKLGGRLRAAGTLEGPWRGAQFNGVLEHYAENPADASTIHGAVKLGIGELTRLDAEVLVDSLSMNLLRRTYPAIPVTGRLRGRANVHGFLDSLAVDVGLRGSAGTVTAQGMIGVRDSAVILALTGTFDSLDLHGMREVQPPSELTGTWATNIVVPSDTLRVATGTATLGITGVTLGQVALGPGGFRFRLEPDVIALDSGVLAFNGGALQASGAIGRSSGATGTLNLALHADTIGYLEPLVRFFAVRPPDTSVVKLDGRGTLNASITGNVSAWTLNGDVAVDGVRVGQNVAQAVTLHAEVARGDSGITLEARARADTLRTGTKGYRPVRIDVAGRPDSLAIAANVGFQQTSAVRARVTTWAPDSTTRMVQLENLELDLPVHQWRLTNPALARIRNDEVSMDSIDFRATSGRGFLVAAGRLSRGGSSDFTLTADSIPLEDLYAAMQRDTAGIKGSVSADARVQGPAPDPVIHLGASLSEGRMGDYYLPLLEVEGAYEDRVLTLTGALSRDGVQLITVHGTGPLDLSLTRVTDRVLDGPIDIVAEADTLDMRVFNALTSTITGVSGTMAMNMRASGTWNDPRFSGFLDITRGTVQVPSIGASYSEMELRFENRGDSIWSMKNGTIRSGGTLSIDGRVNFAKLTHPVLDFDLAAVQFAAFNIASLGSLTATGTLKLEGPLIGATLSGNVVADAATLRFANLVQKRIVSLDDPEFRAMVDSNLAGRDLAPGGHQIFFDSLRIANLSLEMGPDVWLRSSEANIQLAGNMRVQRGFEDNLARYRIDGTLRALRGNYKLAIGLENSPIQVTRDFRVTRGTVRFFGTPDLNPEMDVAAEYTTRTVQREPLTVRAIIEGTLLYPRLRLESDSRLPLTETEIASYLMFGTPSPTFGTSTLGSQATVVAGSFAGSVGQAFANELGIPINYLTITPGTGQATTAQGGPQANSARVEAGAQLGERTFLTLNAGLCEVRTQKLGGVGASIEYRLSDMFSLASSFEPVIQTCGTALPPSFASRYQLGFDIFWQTGIR